MKKNRNKNFRESGSGLVEVVLALAVFVLIAPALVLLALGAISNTAKEKDNLQAEALAQEGFEAARAMRDFDWESLPAGTHGIADGSGYWEFSGTSTSVEKFTRTLTVTDENSYTKNVSVQVTWENFGRSNSINSSMNLSDWKTLRWAQSSDGDFLTGTTNSAFLSSEADGLQLVSIGSWDNASLLTAYDFSGDSDVKSIFIRDNTLYAVTKNNGSGREFFAIDLTRVASHGLVVIGETELGVNVNKVWVQEGYAYAATDSNSQEIMVVRLSDFTKINSINIPGSIATSVAADENFLYVGTGRNSSGNEFFIYDIANPEGSISSIGSLEISAKINDIHVKNGYAYLATDGESELIVVRLSDRNIVNRLNLDDDEANALYEYQGKLYAGAEERLSIINISNPEGSLPIEGEINLDSADSINDVYVYGRRAYVATDRGGSNEVAVLDLDTLTVESWINATGGSVADAIRLYGAYLYVGLRENGNTLQVIRPGEGTSTIGVDFVEEGIYVSQSFDTGSPSTTYKNLSWVSEGTGTISFQLRTADSQDNLSNALWVGPDGDDASYYTATTTPIMLYPSATGSRWIQYRVFFQGDGQSTPVLKTVTITYDR